MKNIKSSKVFENLKPSDEQKKMIYNRLKNEIVKNNSDITVENDGVEIVKRKKINMKSALYPSLAAAVLIVVIAAAIPGLKDNEFNAVEKHPADVTSTESSELDIKSSVFDSGMSYTAESIGDDLYGFIGSHDGRFYCSKKYNQCESPYGKLSDYPFDKRLENENDEEISYISDVISNEKIFILGMDNDYHYSVCVYNNDLTKMLFSMYNDTECSMIAQGNDKDSLYAACSEYVDGSNHEKEYIQKRNLKDEIISQADLEDYGLGNGYVLDLFAMKSGDVAAIYISKDDYVCNVSIILFDSDLNYKDTVTSNEISDTQMILAEYDDKLYLVYNNFLNGVTTGNIDLPDTQINIYSVDFEHQVLTQQPCQIPVITYDENAYPQMANIYSGSNGYDFFFQNSDAALYGYKIKDNTMEKVQENNDPDLYNVFYVGDELYGSDIKYPNNGTILSSFCDDDVVFCSDPETANYYKRDMLMPDGHIAEWFSKDKNHYIVYDINPDPGSAELTQITEIETDQYISACIIKDEYIAALCLDIQTDDDYKSKINIYNKAGTLLNTITSDKGMVQDLFITAENRIFATIYDEKTNKSYGAEVNVETGTMKSIQLSWLKFFTAQSHIVGSDGYSAFFIGDDGVYSAVEKDDDYECEKIVDFHKVDFPDGVYGRDIYDFAYDRNGNIYLRTIDCMVYMLKEKYK